MVLAYSRDQAGCPKEFNKYVLKACCVPGTVLGAGDTAVNVRDMTESLPSELMVKIQCQVVTVWGGCGHAECWVCAAGTGMQL